MILGVRGRAGCIHPVVLSRPYIELKSSHRIRYARVTTFSSSSSLFSPFFLDHHVPLLDISSVDILHMGYFYDPRFIQTPEQFQMFRGHASNNPLPSMWFRAFSICCCFTTCVVERRQPNLSRLCIWLALG